MTSYYVLHIWGDVEPNLQGPFPTADLRDQCARGLRHADPELSDGVFQLNVSLPANIEPRVSVDAYSSRALEGGAR